MNQEKIGKFIAECRKEQHLTQAVLAEKLGITDRAVSKWETGKNMPDASVMLELCEILKINVNELLTGEHIIMDNYKEIAEQNLVEMNAQKEKADRKLLKAARVFMIFLVAMMGAFYALDAIYDFWEDGGSEAYSGTWVGIAYIIVKALLCVAPAVIVFAAAIYAVMLEHDAGYYECPNCKKRYVPTMKAVILASHTLTSRRMKCPYCGKTGYHKKVFTKDE